MDQTAPAPVSTAEFKAQNPELAEMIMFGAGGIVQKVELENPGLPGDEKRAIALTEFEKFLINLKNQTHLFIPIHPLVNLGLDLTLPFASDAIEAACNLFKAGGLFGPKAESETPTDGQQ